MVVQIIVVAAGALATAGIVFFEWRTSRALPADERPPLRDDSAPGCGGAGASD